MTLHDLSFAQLRDRLLADGLSGSHALPLFKALHQELEVAPGERTDFPPPLQRWLRSPAGLAGQKLEQGHETASDDGWTRKFLLRLEDRQEVESVLMGFPGRFTACLSTQIGCAMGCILCATGQMGFRRHLRAGEIVAQAHHVERIVRGLTGERVRNLVLMGMGEPLHNYDATMQALEILTDTRGMNIGPVRVTISTVGHVPGIQKLARDPKRYNLAVSLHGTTEAEREALVPVNRKWPLAEVLEACREYSELKGQRVFMAWTLIAGVNDETAHAHRLAALLKGMNVHVNLIPLNPTDDFSGSAPEWGRVVAFQKVLREAAVPSTVRQRRGIDVAAGCGQLTTASR